MFKACLQQVLVSYEQATMENDREDFLFALQGLLRLLAVMTYDAVLCQEFASADIERAAALRPDGDAAIQQPASTDMELLPLLCSILLEAPNSLCILLISCVLQNMSSCSGLSLFFFHTQRSWAPVCGSKTSGSHCSARPSRTSSAPSRAAATRPSRWSSCCSSRSRPLSSATAVCST